MKQLTDLMYFKYLYSIHDLMEFSDWIKEINVGEAIVIKFHRPPTKSINNALCFIVERQGKCQFSEKLPLLCL